MPQRWSNPVVTEEHELARPEIDACLPDEMLMQVCRMTAVEAEEMADCMADLRRVSGLISQDCRRQHHLELSITLLASVLGQLPRHNPVHLPFGFGGTRVQTYRWIDQDTLDGIAKQIVGLVRHDDEPDAVASAVEGAVGNAVRLGFLDQKRYDAWRPGMPSGSGWRFAMMATPYGVTKARIARTSHRRSAGRTAADRQKTAPKPATPITASRPPAVPPRRAAVDDAYAWARQADLVRAANQVLGQGMLNKGVLSRACRSGRVETNGVSGRGSRVRATSFLTWLGRQFSLPTEEQTQVRNAIIGELTSRNS